MKKVKEVTVLPGRGFIQALYVERDLPPEIQGGVWQVLYIWKGQDSARGNEGPGQGRELLRPGRACAATRDLRLP